MYFLTFYLAFILAFYLASILTSSLTWALPNLNRERKEGGKGREGKGREGKGREGKEGRTTRRRGRASDIKSNNPHPAGGEK